MSDETRCSFCETLPTMAPGSWGGRASKCPLCRQALWTGSDGSTYRLSDAPAPSRTKRGWVIGAGLLATVGVIVGCYVAFKTRDVENSNVAAPIQARSEPVAKADGPIVQAKWAWPAYDAQAKPLPARVVKGTPTPKPTVVAQATAPIAKPPVVVEAPVLEKDRWYSVSENLQGQLASVPQIDLDPDYLKKSKTEIAAVAKEIVDATKKDKDAFVRKLMKDREDMAGLPFLLGKDCTISGSQAKALASTALFARMALSEALKPSRYTYSKYEKTKKDEPSERFWATMDAYDHRRDSTKAETIPALRQIVLAEHQEFRLSLVNRFKDFKDAQATEMLVNRAVFDLEPEIRQAAIEALRMRPVAEYRPALEKALRYPWRPVVKHAVETVVALDVQTMMPHMLGLLNEPAPESPVAVVDKDGVQKTVVRELVRINHHRNCMLCHAPMELSGDNVRISRDLPVGPAPSADEPLPPSSSSVYYSPRKGITLVRADITYLRQDFSLQQPVDDRGQWSQLQRFDFLVRTRMATPHDAAQSVNHARQYREVVGAALLSLAANRAEATARAFRR